MQVHQKLNILRAFFVVFFLLPPTVVFAKDSGVNAHLESILEPFLGTYFSHDEQGREKVISVFLSENTLHAWELGGNPVMIWQDFLYPLALHETKEEQESLRGDVRYMGGYGSYKSSIEYHGEPGVLVITETTMDQNERHMRREERRLIRDGEKLYYVFVRKYYRRKYIFWGPWVQDRGSENIQKDTRSQTFGFEKQSTASIPLEELAQLAQDREEMLYGAYKRPALPVAEVATHEKTQRIATAEIVKFPSRHFICEKIFGE